MGGSLISVPRQLVNVPATIKVNDALLELEQTCTSWDAPRVARPKGPPLPQYEELLAELQRIYRPIATREHRVCYQFRSPPVTPVPTRAPAPSPTPVPTATWEQIEVAQAEHRQRQEEQAQQPVRLPEPLDLSSVRAQRTYG